MKIGNKNWKTEHIAIFVALALAVPLVMSIVWHFAPWLIVLGVLVALSVVAVKAGFLSAFFSGSSHAIAAVNPGQGFARENESAYAASFPAGGPHQAPRKGGVAGLWDALWNSEHHLWVIGGCILWVLCPFDLDFLPVMGWVDDGVAISLAIKHGCDLFGLTSVRRQPISASRAPLTLSAEKPPVVNARGPDDLAA